MGALALVADLPQPPRRRRKRSRRDSVRRNGHLAGQYTFVIVVVRENRGESGHRLSRRTRGVSSTRGVWPGRRLTRRASPRSGDAVGSLVAFIVPPASPSGTRSHPGWVPTLRQDSEQGSELGTMPAESPKPEEEPRPRRDDPNCQPSLPCRGERAMGRSNLAEGRPLRTPRTSLSQTAVSGPSEPYPHLPRWLNLSIRFLHVS